MNDWFYRELDPEKRWKLLQAASDTEENQEAKRLFLLRHCNPKTGKMDPEKDQYLWFLLSLVVTAAKKPVFAKSEAKRTLRELGKLGYQKDSPFADVFQKEMQNAALRFVRASGTEDTGRRWFGMGKSSEELRLSDQCRDAWRIIYGAPSYLHLEEELRPVSEATKEAYYSVDSKAPARLEALDRKMRPEIYKDKT